MDLPIGSKQLVRNVFLQINVHNTSDERISPENSSLKMFSFHSCCGYLSSCYQLDQVYEFVEAKSESERLSLKPMLGHFSCDNTNLHNIIHFIHYSLEDGIQGSCTLFSLSPKHSSELSTGKFLNVFMPESYFIFTMLSSVFEPRSFALQLTPLNTIPTRAIFNSSATCNLVFTFYIFVNDKSV